MPEENQPIFDRETPCTRCGGFNHAAADCPLDVTDDELRLRNAHQIAGADEEPALPGMGKD